MRNLTDRQLDILQQASDGLTINEIASRLGVSEMTVKNIRMAIFRKLRAVNMPHAVAIGYQTGILPLVKDD